LAELFNRLDELGPVNLDVLLDLIALVLGNVSLLLQFLNMVFDLLLGRLNLCNLAFQLIEVCFLSVELMLAVLLHLSASLGVDEYLLASDIIFLQLFFELGL
jgi:hypothetical protein